MARALTPAPPCSRRRLGRPGAFPILNEPVMQGNSTTLSVIDAQPALLWPGQAVVLLLLRAQDIKHRLHLDFRGMRLRARAAQRDRTDQRQPAPFEILL
jgi:hypothetical protein